MFPKKPLYKTLIGLLIIIIVVITYLFFKFGFYEEQVIAKIRIYNKSVERYYTQLEKMDSISVSKFKKYEFVYLTEQKELPKGYGTNYKGFLNWISEEIKKIKELNDKIDKLIRLSAGKDSLKNNELQVSDELLKVDTSKKAKQELMYSPEELIDIYEETRSDRKEMYDKQIKK